jgi:hypothetical protein
MTLPLGYRGSRFQLARVSCLQKLRFFDPWLLGIP